MAVLTRFNYLDLLNFHEKKSHATITAIVKV